MTKLTTAELDRAVGLLLAAAAGDALGAGHEFEQPPTPGTGVRMTGGPSDRAPGEWTGDTSMAVVVARVAADDLDLRSDAARGQIAADWAEYERAGGSAGNGSLMRTAPVVLAHLRDEAALAEAAESLSSFTNHDPEAGEACVLWCLAMRHAVLTGEIDARVGLGRLAPDRAEVWATRLGEAEAAPPSEFAGNGTAAGALQGAWSAIARTPVPEDNPREGIFRAQHLRLAMEEALRGGHDAGTAAAVAGGLLGAAYGASAVPAAWRRVLHGWPGLRTRDLTALATRIVTGEPPAEIDFSVAGDLSSIGRHPYDKGLWIGGYKALRDLPPEVDVVVSLCEIAPDDLPDAVELIEVPLVDLPYPHENPNLAFLLHDTADLLLALRAEGRTVLLHSLRAKSRVPVVACFYGLRLHPVPTTLVIAEVEAVLFGARMNTHFRDVLEAVGPLDERRKTPTRPGRAGPPRRGSKSVSRGDWPAGRSPTSWD